MAIEPPITIGVNTTAKAIKENLRWGNKEATDEEIIHACELAQADPFVQTFPKKYNTYI